MNETIEKENYFKGFDNDIEEIQIEEVEESSKEEEKASENSKEEEKKAEEKGEKTETEEEKAKTEEKSDQKNEETKVEPKQSKQTNSYFAELRRKKEQEEKLKQENEERAKRENTIRAEAKLEAELGMIKENPYTKEKITDEEDLKIYKIQKAIEDKGGDPIGDLSKEIARINREERMQAKAKAEQEAKAKTETDSKAKEDVENFIKDYPNVDTKELANNTDFQTFANDKFGRWTLKEIYEAFQEKNAKSNEQKAKEEDAKKKVVEDASKNISKTPSSQANSNNAPKDFMEMTDEEYRKYEESIHGKDFF